MALLGKSRPKMREARDSLLQESYKKTSEWTQGQLELVHSPPTRRCRNHSYVATRWSGLTIIGKNWPLLTLLPIMDHNLLLGVQALALECKLWPLNVNCGP